MMVAALERQPQCLEQHSLKLQTSSGLGSTSPPIGMQDESLSIMGELSGIELDGAALGLETLEGVAVSFEDDNDGPQRH